MTASYRVVTKDNLEELAKELSCDKDELAEEFAQASMRDQYVMYIRDDQWVQTRWWKFIADSKFGSDYVFDEIKKELNL